MQKDTPPESGVPLRKFIGGSEANGAAHKVMPSVTARDLRPVNHMKGDSSKRASQCCPTVPSLNYNIGKTDKTDNFLPPAAPFALASSVLRIGTRFCLLEMFIASFKYDMHPKSL